MPYIPHTPEGLLIRNRHSRSHGYGVGGGDTGYENDDDDALCRGVTVKGESCRRTVAAARTFGREANGVGDVALYCWQHKDQAEQRLGDEGAGRGRGEMRRKKGNNEKMTMAMATATVTARTAKAPVLRERSSIDTLVVRLGMIDVDGGGEEKKEVSRHGLAARQDHGDNYPSSKKDEEKNRMHVIDEKGRYTRDKRYSDHGRHRDRRASGRKKSSGSRGWLSAFCFAAGGSDSDNDDYFEIVRHKARVADQIKRAEMVAEAKKSNNSHSPDQSLPLHRSHNRNSKAMVEPGGREAQTPLDATSHLLSFIPKSLSPQLTSQLLAELSKPISPSDDKGYIYMFWLTDSKTSTPSPNARSSLLSSNINDKKSPEHHHMGENMSTAAARAEPNNNSNNNNLDNNNNNQSVLLKIGRASNVHRRMNEWTRQCNYNLSLLRWYPYSPSSPQPSSSSSSSSSSSTPPPSSVPRTDAAFRAFPLAPHDQSSRHRRRPGSQQAILSAQNDGTGDKKNNAVSVEKVPHVHRVERLIHIELAEKRVRKSCAACGKEHREWFEVESSREGVRRVDEVVRRWVGWSHGQQGRG